MRFFPSSLFWIEKVICLIDYLQLFVIIWVAAQPWPWPYMWTTWTRWTVVFNFDFFSLTKNGALAGQSSNPISQWGEMDGYLGYALIYSIISLILFATIQITYRLSNSYGKRYDLFQPYILCGLYLLSYIYYLPQLLALFRLFYCDSDTFELSADPTVKCTDTSYLVIMILSLIFSLPLTIYLPYILYQIIIDTTVYRNSADHEKQLQVYELFYMLNIDESWMNNDIYAVSSFTLKGSHYYMHMICYKFIMLLLFIFVRGNFEAQSVLMWTFTVAFLCHYGFLYPPYRCWSSNILLSTYLSLLLIDVSFGVANAFHVQNGIMVNSSESMWILTFHFFALLIVLSVILFSLLYPHAASAPCLDTLITIQNDPKYCRKVWNWVSVIKQSYSTRYDFIACHNIIADIDSFEESIRELHKSWLEAKFHGSIFTNPIGELLEDKLRIHTLRNKKCLRKHYEWNRIYIQCVKEKIFVKRHYKYILMSPLKKKILMKILAVRAFMAAAEKRLQIASTVLFTTNLNNSQNNNTTNNKDKVAIRKRRFSVSGVALNNNHFGCNTSAPSSPLHHNSHFPSSNNSPSQMLSITSKASSKFYNFYDLNSDDDDDDDEDDDSNNDDHSGRDNHYDDHLYNNNAATTPGMNPKNRKSSSHILTNDMIVANTIQAIKELEHLTESKLNYYRDIERNKRSKNMNSGISNTSNNKNNIDSSVSPVKTDLIQLQPLISVDVDDDNNIYNTIYNEKNVDDWRKMDELFTTWDNIIYMYENETLLPNTVTANSVFSSVQVEDWYTLRAALSTQLERFYEDGDD